SPSAACETACRCWGRAGCARAARSGVTWSARASRTTWTAPPRCRTSASPPRCSGGLPTRRRARGRPDSRPGRGPPGSAPRRDQPGRGAAAAELAEALADRGLDPGGVEPEAHDELALVAMVDEAVRQPEVQDRAHDARGGERLGHRAPGAARDDVLFDRHERLVAARE